MAEHPTNCTCRECEVQAAYERGRRESVIPSTDLLDAAVDVIEASVDAVSCQYDHNDFCQVHSCAKPCYNEMGLAWLKKFHASNAEHDTRQQQNNQKGQTP